jgi:hypothetical protein
VRVLNLAAVLRVSVVERRTGTATYISFVPSFRRTSSAFLCPLPYVNSFNNVVERQAAEQLHVEIIPGTEVMTDIGGFHLAKAGGNGSV